MTIKELLEIRNSNYNVYLISDLYREEDKDDPYDFIDVNDNHSFENDLINRLSASAILDDIMNNTDLTENELLVIKLKYGLTSIEECKQQDITSIINLSKQRVSQIKYNGLKKLNKTAIRLSYVDKSKKYNLVNKKI